MVVFDINHNFWEVNKQFKYLTPYSDLYNQDETPDKDYSSKQMWCIAMMQDVSTKNQYRSMPFDQKLDACKVYFPMFELDDVQKQYVDYPKVVMTDRQRSFQKASESLHELEDTIQLLTNRLHSLAKDDPDNFIDKDVQGLFAKVGAMKKGMKKVYEEHTDIERLLMEEEGDSTLFGGGVENSFDRGEMPHIEDEY